MTPRLLALAAALPLALLGACAADAPEQPAPAMDSPEAMMEAMAALAAPGPEHAEIASWAGDWTVKLRMRMGPDAPWQETAGTAKFTSLLGGRYLQQQLNCTMKMGDVEMPFESIEMFGFNNVSKEYEAWWFDAMGTSVTYSAGKKVNGVIELRGLMKDAITPEGREALFTHRSVDENHFFGEGFHTIPPHGMIKVIELEYTRVLP